MHGTPEDLAPLGPQLSGPRKSGPTSPATVASGVRDAVTGAVAEARDAMSDAVASVAVAVKPKLRGWIHAGSFPLVVAASIVLIVLAPPVAGKVACAVFGFTACLLFGTSAVYHRGKWSPRGTAILRRADHSNIFLIIAGTYTPIAVLLLAKPAAITLLAIVWSGAVAGLLARILWLNAPRWIYVPIYVALGWVAIGYMSPIWRAGGPAVVWLIVAGGLAYTLGAVVYGTRWPDPSPRWFGFHEIFHVLTVAGFTCHFTAIMIVAVAAR